MIDIHSHILPAVDDGPKTIEDSICMARQAADEGVMSICATPHILGEITPTGEQNINRSFELLKSRIDSDGLNLRLMLGSEIYVRSDIITLRKHALFSLNQTGRYVLIELPLSKIPVGIDQLVFHLRLEGITPIIAHPERSLTENDQLQQVAALVSQGALMQVNAGSIMGQFGKLCRKMAEGLLRLGLVHMVASDAHDTRTRSFSVLSQAYRKVTGMLAQNEAQKLFMHNPEKVLAGKSLFGEDWPDQEENENAKWQTQLSDNHLNPVKLIPGGIR